MAGNFRKTANVNRLIIFPSTAIVSTVEERADQEILMHLRGLEELHKFALIIGNLLEIDYMANKLRNSDHV